MQATADITVPRTAYAALAAALLAAVAVGALDGHWLPALIGALAPDLALALGAGPQMAHGQLHPRAVGVYNALHRFHGPLLVIAAGAIMGTGLLVGGLAWAFHVALDRSVGYGLRTPEGFQRG
jgi:hypothetical protein